MPVVSSPPPLPLLLDEPLNLLVAEFHPWQLSFIYEIILGQENRKSHWKILSAGKNVVDYYDV
jgi:hypothetical protein